MCFDITEINIIRAAIDKFNFLIALRQCFLCDVQKTELFRDIIYTCGAKGTDKHGRTCAWLDTTEYN